jgi:hypothetical protein
MVVLYWKLEGYKANSDAAEKYPYFFYTKMKMVFLGQLRKYLKKTTTIEERKALEKSAKTIRNYFILSFVIVAFLIISTTIYGFSISTFLE